MTLPLFEQVERELKVLLDTVCSSHGFDHAKAVLDHVDKALATELIDDNLKICIRLAALLHDADDHKLFKTVDYQNARQLMRHYPTDISNSAINMIDLVSCSKNHDTIVDNEYYLYPRYADRLEAIGKIGIWRCYKYCSTIKSPLFTPSTKRYTTIEALKETKSRYLEYNGHSESMIDHFYDKLLHLADFTTTNQYFNQIKADRMQPIYDVVFEFGKTGVIDKETINKL